MSAQPPVFLIKSPDYTYLHSGVRCLFLLCHHLNRLGYEAYITGTGAPDAMRAPHADERLIRGLRRQGRDDIVIYPEITEGNPLEGRKVVRYLLQKRIAKHSRGDYFIHFADEFQLEDVKSLGLRIPLLDRQVFNRGAATHERSGFLIYSVRHTPDLTTLPAWLKRPTLISRKEPRDPETLADLYRRSRALITWERTAAVGEALHCGCPVMLIPNPGFDHELIIKGTFMAGLVVGWDKPGLKRAERTIRFFPLIYRMQTRGVSRQIRRFVSEATAYFDERGVRPPTGDRRKSKQRQKAGMTVV